MARTLPFTWGARACQVRGAGHTAACSQDAAPGAAPTGTQPQNTKEEEASKPRERTLPMLSSRKSCALASAPGTAPTAPGAAASTPATPEAF